MAEANTGQGGRPDPLNVKNPRTNVDFLSRRAKSERLCVGFGMRRRQSQPSVAIYRLYAGA